MIDRLIEIIGREAAVFECFLELLEKQQEALVKNDLEALKNITSLQREKLVESQLLNKQREELVEEIKQVNLISGDLNVTRLLKLVDKDRADRLSRLKNSILALNDKINDVRNQNALLLNRSREYIHKTMEMLSRINHPESTYSRTGSQSRHEANVAMDRRA
ncbi:MAG: flagellar protein FlgN [candidate division Zixibacteria bacterium]|nr:flagellar protein FlgN [candidate division Zixibacteria bacterium]